MSDHKHKGSTDIWFSSFLTLKGYKVCHFDVIARGKVNYYFELTEEEWKQLKLEFNDSEYSKFKQIQESLKDMAF